MEQLHEFLVAKRSEIIQRWTEAIRDSLTPVPITRLELVDHLPIFLDELTATLRQHAAGGPPRASSPTAGAHGVQRFRLGFNLEGLVREYGILRRCIRELAEESGLKMSPEELDVIFECLISGIADAVTQYAREREAERQRQSNEHFAFVAHELRNPLSAGLYALASLKRKGLVPSNRQLEILEKSLGRMHDLIEHTLGLALVDAGIHLRRQHLAVRALVADASIEAMAQAEEKGVQLDLQSAGEEMIDADERLILSALNNLIRNAVKFTHPGTTVRVRWQQGIGQMNIEVEDECGGLPPGPHDNLFTPFVQAGADRSGFGLGLSIAKQAVEAHGGSIQVRNLPGKGCIFLMRLPTAQEQY